MTNQAKTNFMISQQKVRNEFIDCFEFQNNNQFVELKTQQDVFLTWLKQPKILKKLGYVTSVNIDNDEINLANEEAAMDYEKSIMYYLGMKLWNNHRTAFRENKKYYCNHLRKPFNISITNFYHCMREYGDMLHYLPPPTQKGCKKSTKADWEALVSINEEVILTLTFDALPLDYRRHIKSNYKLDFLDMEEVDFVNSMLSFKLMDNTQRAK